MTYEYIVPLQPKAQRQEIEWAWRFTVLARAAGHCQHCGKQRRLDCAHITSRKAEPAREFDPDNGMGLCHSCHMKFDHLNGHRPSGRPVGYKMPDEWKVKMAIVNKQSHNTPEYRAKAPELAKAHWDKRGRKNGPRDCEHCKTPITGHKLYATNRFCSPACHYAFRTGKPRTGY